MMSKFQIFLPNQSSLKFKLPEDSAAWRDWIPVERASSKNQKRANPILMNNPVSNYQVVFVDFDGLEDEVSVLNTLVTKSLIIPMIFSSVSGKIKAGYVVRFKGLPTLQDKMDFLKEVLPEELFPLVDRMGVERCFVNETTLPELSYQVAVAPICTWHCESHKDIVYSSKSFAYFSDEVLDARLEKYLEFFKDKPLARDVLKILQTTFHMAGEGFGISTAVLSRQLGVNHRFVSETLKKLQELNLIECVDSSYVKGSKARIYVAKWTLKTVIAEKKAKHSSTKPLPTACVRGQTYRMFLSALGKFKDASKFLEWADSLPGIELRGRRCMAKAMARCYERRAA